MTVKLIDSRRLSHVEELGLSDSMSLYNTTKINLNTAQEAFNQLSVDERLALLWFMYEKIGQSITPAAPEAASPDIAQGLYDQVKSKPQPEQLDIMRNLMTGENIQIGREYGSLSANTQLAFWYYLAQGMEKGDIIPMPDDYQLSSQGNELLGTISLLEFQQQITVLRDIVRAMGAEPAVGAKI